MEAEIKKKYWFEEDSNELPPLIFKDGLLYSQSKTSSDLESPKKDTKKYIIPQKNCNKKTVKTVKKL